MHQRREVERRKAFVAPTPVAYKLKPRRPKLYANRSAREDLEAGGAFRTPPCESSTTVYNAAFGSTTVGCTTAFVEQFWLR